MSDPDSFGSLIAETSSGNFCAVNPHCLGSIVRLSDEMDIRASTDIVDVRGIKLWAKGAPVSRELHEKILSRRLRRPLETSLDVAPGASMEAILSDCFELMERSPSLGALGGIKGARSVLRGVRGIQLPAPLKLLLTSAREHKKHSYEVSLSTMIICAGLACEASLADNDAINLVVAALVHDVGEMYINPDYLERSRYLQPNEWKHVVSHPCVGQAFLKEFTRFPTSVTECVLHHHERMDGSGYPFQVPGTRMNTLGQLISVADSASAIIMRGGTGLAERLAVALRIVPDEYPKRAVSFLTRTLAELSEPTSPTDIGAFSNELLPLLCQIRGARREAEALSGEQNNKNVKNASSYALDVLANIDKSLRATGVYDISQLEALQNDPAVMGEICLVMGEVRWRLRNLARNIFLRTEKTGTASDLSAIAGLVSILDTGENTP